MEGIQMSIFDFMPAPTTEKSLEDYEEKEMVQIVSQATGIDFRYKDDLYGWVWNKGKVSFGVKFGRFSVDDHARFIGCDWTDKRGGYSGCSSPCRSIDEAIKFFKKFKERL